VSENGLQASLIPNDLVSNNPPRIFPLSLNKHGEMTAWADMLSRIGQRNIQLSDLVARDFPTPDAAHRKGQPEGHRGSSGDNLIRELERERSRIARELHAGAGQPLAGIKLNLEMLDDCATALPPAGLEALARLQTLAEQALAQVRAVSHKLYPPDWQALGVEDALRRLVRSSGLTERIQVILDIHPMPEEPPHAVKIALYRCAQECLSNVSRHSGATELKVSLEAKGPMIELRVEDNGRGLSPDEGESKGIGMKALREHAAALGGSCQVMGKSDGVLVIVRLPLDED
jgi:two-component system, NarL family, sensor kinase